ncbi:hypothetical protein DFP94_1071, partial [Fontibacillus phaseoli]
GLSGQTLGPSTRIAGGFLFRTLSRTQLTKVKTKQATLILGDLSFDQ